MTQRTTAQDTRHAIQAHNRVTSPPPTPQWQYSWGMGTTSGGVLQQGLKKYTSWGGTRTCTEALAGGHTYLQQQLAERTLGRGTHELAQRPSRWAGGDPPGWAPFCSFPGPKLDGRRCLMPEGGASQAQGGWGGGRGTWQSLASGAQGAVRRPECPPCTEKLLRAECGVLRNQPGFPGVLELELALLQDFFLA